MSDSKQLTIAIHEAFSNNAFDQVLALCHENVEVHAHAFGAVFTGKEGFMQFMQSFKTGFPDVRIAHEHFVVEGGSVAVQFTGRGTHTGTLQTPAGDIPATGKKVELHVAEFLVWENGKLRSLHNYQDAGSLLRQIGAM
ncbi:MAG: ester cyclase [Chitinophagales bacterium]